MPKYELTKSVNRSNGWETLSVEDRFMKPLQPIFLTGRQKPLSWLYQQTWHSFQTNAVAKHTEIQKQQIDKSKS